MCNNLTSGKVERGGARAGLGARAGRRRSVQGGSVAGIHCLEGHLLAEISLTRHLMNLYYQF